MKLPSKFSEWDGWPDPWAVWRSPWQRRWRWKRFRFERGRQVAGGPSNVWYWEWENP
jgi:hypothetical protein